MTEASIAGVGHNRATISPPSETEFLADLKDRYPTVQPTLDEFEAALKTFPEKIEDEEAAQKLQDLLRKMTMHKGSWKSWRGEEKKPWDKIAKIAQAFFGTAEDKIDEWTALWKPRHTAFLEAKAERARMAAEEQAKKQREEAARLQRDAEEAEQRRIEAERKEAEARAAEEAARLRAADEERKAREARERAEAAAAEEKRLAEEKRAREKAERDANADAFKLAKTSLKDANRLDDLASANEINPDEEERLDTLIRAGGVISTIGSTLSHSLLLDDEQKATLAAIKTSLSGLRAAQEDRAQAIESAKAAGRAEAQRIEQARLDAEAQARAADRETQRLADEARTTAAREAREAAEREAATAKEAVAEARQEVRDARAGAREAVGDQKDAARTERLAGAQAVKTENRASRMEQKLDNSSDADMSRTRGELGTTGSLSGRFAFIVQDRDALTAYFGPLGSYLNPDHADSAVYRYMRQHQGEWGRVERVTGRIPGVIFVWETESRIA